MLTGSDHRQVDVLGEKLEVLEEKLGGEVITPGDSGYGEARTIYTVMIDQETALFARCATAADVITTLGFARAHGDFFPVSISWIMGFSPQPGLVTISLHRLFTAVIADLMPGIRRVVKKDVSENGLILMPH